VQHLASLVFAEEAVQGGGRGHVVACAVSPSCCGRGKPHASQVSPPTQQKSDISEVITDDEIPSAAASLHLEAAHAAGCGTCPRSTRALPQPGCPTTSHKDPGSVLDKGQHISCTMADLWDCYGPPPATGSDDEAWSEHSNDQGTPDGGGCGRNGRGAGATSASRKRTRAQQLLLMRGLRPPGSVPLPPSPPPADDLERELLLLRDAAQQAANPSGGAAAPLRLSDSDDERSAAAAAKADVSLGLAQLSEAGRAAAAHARALERELSEAQTLAAGCASQEAEELPEREYDTAQRAQCMTLHLPRLAIFRSAVCAACSASRLVLPPPPLLPQYRCHSHL
jgi:hypothetical protein